MKRLEFAPERKLVEVELKDVPEITSADLWRVQANIGLRRKFDRAPSFGAYVIRQVGEDRDAFQSLVKGFSWSMVTEHEHSKKLTGLHDDRLLSSYTSENNYLSYYEAIRGITEVIILKGSVLRRYDPKPLRREQALQLFNESLIDRSDVTMPARALYAELNPGDAMLFDTTQPHTFRVAPGAEDRYCISIAARGRELVGTGSVSQVY